MFTGDYNGDGKTDVLFYYKGDGNWWMGLSNGQTLAWHGAGSSGGFGNLLDGVHHWLRGDFNAMARATSRSTPTATATGSRAARTVSRSTGMLPAT